MKKISRFLAFLLSLSLLVSCQTSKFSIELLDVADYGEDITYSGEDQDPEVKGIESKFVYKKDSEGYWQGLYKINGGKEESELEISLYKFEDGKIKELFSKDKLKVKRDSKLFLNIKNDRLIIKRADLEKPKQILEHKFEKLDENREVGGYFHEENMKLDDDDKGIHAITYLANFNDNEESDRLPGVKNFDDIKDWISEFKEDSGMIIRMDYIK